MSKMTQQFFSLLFVWLLFCCSVGSLNNSLFVDALVTPRTLNDISSQKNVPTMQILTTQSSMHHLPWKLCHLKQCTLQRTKALAASSTPSNNDDNSNDDDSKTIWMPRLRYVMASIGFIGAMETGILTYDKLSGSTTQNILLAPLAKLCTSSSSVGASTCSDVLSGPYSWIPGTHQQIPLSLLGCMAYITVIVLALEPFLMVDGNIMEDDRRNIDENYDESFNRMALTTITTMMATFSAGLMVLLFGVLQTSCPYCILSAVCSISLAKIAWIGGCLPSTRTQEQKAEMGGVMIGALVSIVFAALLWISPNDSMTFANAGGDVGESNTDFTSTPSSTTLLAKSETKKQEPLLYRPPDITTESSSDAIQLATQLERLNAKMYGAYWCSHCFDQKETFGKEAFSKIPYIECAKDGMNSMSKLCKEKQVPGYPTWEIQNQLYPGEKDIEELQSLVKDLTTESKVVTTSVN